MTDRFPQTLNHERIAGLIPHQGTMCLLARLERWSDTSIDCSADSHRDAANPLRTVSGLLAPASVEYAAQAMALHGALVAKGDADPAPGYLASIRDVTLHVARLDTVEGDLFIHAERQAGSGNIVSYAFDVRDARGQSLVGGRATVVLNSPLP
jgi:predicted hotdog family 3-hydroxylacyl-ACP dehydratase